jgi:hypothetical protein
VGFGLAVGVAGTGVGVDVALGGMAGVWSRGAVEITTSAGVGVGVAATATRAVRGDC